MTGGAIHQVGAPRSATSSAQDRKTPATAPLHRAHIAATAADSQDTVLSMQHERLRMVAGTETERGAI